MRIQTFTAVLERNKIFTTDFETEPYEVGWAVEAIFFIKVLEVKGNDSKLEIIVQISPDGLTWVNNDSNLLTINDKGLYFIKVKDFGNWIRLACKVKGESPYFKLTIYLVLKG
ncbi:MAG: DUF6385 domain-containing protein [Nitrososphaeria archaeon]